MNNIIFPHPLYSKLFSNQNLNLISKEHTGKEKGKRTEKYVKKRRERGFQRRDNK
jgi:hypothetical protein